MLPRNRQAYGDDLEIDWDNPITRDLQFFCPFGDGRLRDMVRGIMPTVSVPGNANYPTRRGAMLYTDDNSSNGLRYDLPDIDVNTAGFTFCFMLQPETSGVRNFGHVFLAEDSGGSDVSRFSQNGLTAGQFRYHLNTSPVKSNIAVPTGEPVHVVVTLEEPSNDWAVYINGSLPVGNSGTSANIRPDLARLWIGRFSSGPYTVSSPIAMFGAWSRALSAAEVKALYLNQNAILKRGRSRQRSRWGFVPTGAEIIAVAAAAMTYAGRTVGVIADDSVDVTAATQTYASQDVLASESATVDPTSVTYTGQETAVSETSVVAPASAGYSGQTVNVQADDNVSAVAAAMSYVGQNVSVLAAEVVAVVAATMLYVGQAISAGGATAVRRARGGMMRAINRFHRLS